MTMPHKGQLITVHHEAGTVEGRVYWIHEDGCLTIDRLDWPRCPASPRGVNYCAPRGVKVRPLAWHPLMVRPCEAPCPTS